MMCLDEITASYKLRKYIWGKEKERKSFYLGACLGACIAPSVALPSCSPVSKSSKFGIHIVVPHAIAITRYTAQVVKKIIFGFTQEYLGFT